jgi:hypothetical protein
MFPNMEMKQNFFSRNFEIIKTKWRSMSHHLVKNVKNIELNVFSIPVKNTVNDVSDSVVFVAWIQYPAPKEAHGVNEHAKNVNELILVALNCQDRIHVKNVFALDTRVDRDIRGREAGKGRLPKKIPMIQSTIQQVSDHITMRMPTPIQRRSVLYLHQSEYSLTLISHLNLTNLYIL